MISMNTLLVGLLVAMSATFAPAQGCEPIRFTTPRLGAEGELYQQAHEWRLTVGLRRLTADEWFVDSEIRNDLSLMGRAPEVNIHTLLVDVAYGVTSRSRVRVALPISRGKLTRLWADSAQHTQSASGLGDLSVLADVWLFEPRSHATGNIALGLGVKVPTGKYDTPSRFYRATSSVAFPADQSIQLGDGGWGIILQGDAFKRITERASVYGAGSYLANPRGHTDVESQPGSKVYLAVPDIYSLRAGGAYDLWRDQGVSGSLGVRVDGLPVHDLLGGGGRAYRRPGYALLAEPGLAVSRGRNTYTLSVPVRLHANRLKSELERSTGAINGGDFAKYLVFAGYSHRF